MEDCLIKTIHEAEVKKFGEKFLIDNPQYSVHSYSKYSNQMFFEIHASEFKTSKRSLALIRYISKYGVAPPVSLLYSDIDHEVSERKVDIGRFYNLLNDTDFLMQYVKFMPEHGNNPTFGYTYIYLQVMNFNSIIQAMRKANNSSDVFNPLDMLRKRELLEHGDKYYVRRPEYSVLHYSKFTSAEYYAANRNKFKIPFTVQLYRYHVEFGKFPSERVNHNGADLNDKMVPYILDYRKLHCTRGSKPDYVVLNRQISHDYVLIRILEYEDLIGRKVDHGNFDDEVTEPPESVNELFEINTSFEQDVEI